MALRSYIHSTFDPRRIPGLHSWWDAADAASVTLDSGRVSQLSDKSGNGRHLTNTTSGSTQPSYVTGGRNGLNVARFAAASVQRLSVPSSTATYRFLHNGTQCYWIAVSSYGASSNPATLNTLFGTMSPSTSNVGWWYAFEDRSGIGNNAINYNVGNGGGIENVAFANNGSVVASSLQNIITPQTVTIQEALMDVSNATVTNRVTFRINGDSSIAFNSAAGSASTANATGSLTVGATSSNTLPMTGDVCELMLFDQQPTAAARDLIRRYLGAKWGVTLA